MNKRLPNIVFITIDAWRYDAIGLASRSNLSRQFGLKRQLETPNLDRFGSKGLFFTQALSSSPYTTSSHASIMTGLFPPRHGVRSFLYESLPENVVTLAQQLKDLDYDTITLRESDSPLEPSLLGKVDVLRGFDTVVHSLEEFAQSCVTSTELDIPVFAFLHLWDLHAPYLYSPWAVQSGSFDSAWDELVEISDLTGVKLPAEDRISDQAMTQFQRNASKRISDKEDRIQLLVDWYIRGVNWFDRHRWPVVEEVLRSVGLLDNAIIFVYGDHGEGVYPDGEGMGVFDHGHSVLDDVIRVPLIIRGLPEQNGAIIDAQVSLVDLVPTVLELLSIDSGSHTEAYKRGPLDGRSLLAPISRMDQSEERIHYAEICKGAEGGDRGQLGRKNLNQSCVRTTRYKVLRQAHPVFMKRYIAKSDRILRRLKTYASRIPYTSDLGDLFYTAKDHQYFWTDLSADPYELKPNQWRTDLPNPLENIKSILDDFSEVNIRGPAIDDRDLTDDAVLKRLAALGYID